MLQSCWDAGGDPDTIMVGSFNKQAMSGFTGSSTRTDKGEDKKLFAAIEVYEYDFGTIRTVPSRHVRSRDAFICRTDMWAWAELRPMFDEELAKTGDARKFHIVNESTLVSRNEKASGMVADLTTS